MQGTYTVPCYLNAPGCPTGSRFLYPPGSTTGPPTWIPGNTMTAKFTCNIPSGAMFMGGARPSLYGHGLFGSRDEVNQGQLQDMAQEHDFVFCATDWIGMACTDLPSSDPQSAAGLFTAYVLTGHAPPAPDCDVPTAIAAETDLSNFPTLVDRMDQAFVNFMYLGRLMIHPQGFSANAAFQNARGHSVIDTSHLYYDGNSQGGIFGGSLIALEPDLTRGVLGVPGMNYSLLLQRSSDFGTGQPPQPDPTNPGSVIPQYAYPLYQAYPNELERQLILSLMQQMWDHSDPNGLAAHMTSNPLPDTPAHVVLMQGGLGDHQVTQFAAEVEARTIGARAHLPWADPGRDPELAAHTGYPRSRATPTTAPPTCCGTSARRAPRPARLATARAGRLRLRSRTPHRPPARTRTSGPGNRRSRASRRAISCNRAARSSTSAATDRAMRGPGPVRSRLAAALIAAALPAAPLASAGPRTVPRLTLPG